MSSNSPFDKVQQFDILLYRFDVRLLPLIAKGEVWFWNKYDAGVWMCKFVGKGIAGVWVMKIWDGKYSFSTWKFISNSWSGNSKHFSPYFFSISILSKIDTSWLLSSSSLRSTEFFLRRIGAFFYLLVRLLELPGFNYYSNFFGGLIYRLLLVTLVIFNYYWLSFDSYALYEDSLSSILILKQEFILLCYLRIFSYSSLKLNKHLL
jgi:hypothetical protein